MFSLVLLLPLISFVSIIVFGSYIGTYGSIIISCTNFLLNFLTAILSFFYISNDFTFPLVYGLELMWLIYQLVLV